MIFGDWALLILKQGKKKRFTQMQVDPKMEEMGGLQPWQLFTALFAAFWAVSAYFENLLMTLVFAVSFGVLAEILSKYMAGEKISYSPKV